MNLDFREIEMMINSKKVHSAIAKIRDLFPIDGEVQPGKVVKH